MVLIKKNSILFLKKLFRIDFIGLVYDKYENVYEFLRTYE